MVIGDLLEVEGAETVARIERAGGHASFRRTDVTVPSDLDALVALAESTYGKLDVVVPNAGIAVAGDAEQEQDFVDRWTPQVPAGFLGTPWDVANVVVFLASDEARWVTGSVYPVDGGFAG